MRSRIQPLRPPSKHCRTLGHERFTSIDRVENNGLDLTGA